MNMINMNTDQNSSSNSIAKKSILLILLASTTITSFFTFFSFYLDYSNEMDLLETTVSQIQKSSLATIASNVWNFNTKETEEQLKGITSITDVILAEVVDQDNKIISVSKSSYYDQGVAFSVSYSWPLILEEGAKDSFGQLKITLTKSNMWKRIGKKMAYFFVTQGLKTLLISFIILLILNSLVINDLLACSRFLSSLDLKSKQNVVFLDAVKPRRKKDEVNQLQDSINDLIKALNHYKQTNEEIMKSLEEKVQDRTKALYNKNKEIETMLRHIKLGIFMIDKDDQICPDYSIYTEKIFQKSRLGGLNAFDLIFDKIKTEDYIRSRIKSLIQVSIDASRHVFDSNKHLLVKEAHSKNEDGIDQILEIDWEPITTDEENVDRIMVIVKDVTEIKNAEKEIEDKKNVLSIIDGILDLSSEKYSLYIDSTKDLLEKAKKSLYDPNLDSEKILSGIFSYVHTIKGNSNLTKFTKMTSLCHEVENLVKALKGKKELLGLEKEELKRKLSSIDNMIFEIESIYSTKIRKNVSYENQKFFEIAKELSITDNKKTSDLSEKEKIQIFANIHDIYLSYKNLKNQSRSIKGLVSSIIETSFDLANRLGKLTPKVHLSSDIDMSLKKEAYDKIEQAFVQLFINSMDHGLEDEEERTQKGKSPEGHVYLTARKDESGKNLLIRFFDDGRGLDINKIALSYQKIKPKDLSGMDDKKIALLIFEQEFSTNDKVKLTSGRGMGLHIVKSNFESLSGTIDIEFKQDKQVGKTRPFEFLMTLPLEKVYG